jgi:HSP20 family molecular chaperone IbpA
LLYQEELPAMSATRLSLFDHPFFLGFDRFERELERLGKGAGGYPPYNVEQLGPDRLRITLAVAGFSAADLDIALEDNHLTISGRQNEEEEADGERLFLHRGIAARQFQRGFVLADGIRVGEAWLDNGLLHIDMTRIVPERRVRRIEIASRGEAGRQEIGVTANAEQRQANGAGKDKERKEV